MESPKQLKTTRLSLIESCLCQSNRLLGAGNSLHLRHQDVETLEEYKFSKRQLNIRSQPVQACCEAGKLELLTTWLRENVYTVEDHFKASAYKYTHCFSKWSTSGIQDLIANLPLLSSQMH